METFWTLETTLVGMFLMELMVCKFLLIQKLLIQTRALLDHLPTVRRSFLWMETRTLGTTLVGMLLMELMVCKPAGLISVELVRPKELVVDLLWLP